MQSVSLRWDSQVCSGYSVIYRCDTLFSSHLLRTGAIEDLVIVSEKQMVKGISRLVAVTGHDAAQVSL